MGFVYMLNSKVFYYFSGSTHHKGITLLNIDSSSGLLQTFKSEVLGSEFYLSVQWKEWTLKSDMDSNLGSLSHLLWSF